MDYRSEKSVSSVGTTAENGRVSPGGATERFVVWAHRDPLEGAGLASAGDALLSSLAGLWVLHTPGNPALKRGSIFFRPFGTVGGRSRRPDAGTPPSTSDRDRGSRVPQSTWRNAPRTTAERYTSGERENRRAGSEVGFVSGFVARLLTKRWDPMFSHRDPNASRKPKGAPTQPVPAQLGGRVRRIPLSPP